MIFDANEYVNNLDEIYPHTEYKIKYVKAYIKYWLEIACNYSTTKNINFIDCMCNAGIYKNDILGTPTEILILFVEFAKNFKYIKFNLFLNDIYTERVNIIKAVLEKKVDYAKIENINVYFSNEDVNQYLSSLLNKNTFFDFNAQAFTVLFVDPYRFGDVEIVRLNAFLNKYRSELIYNYFISDYRRNINNSHAENKQQMMINSMNGIEGYTKDKKADELLYILQNNFKTNTKINYTFAYPFHITNNAELYNIIYGTPHLKGLEQIKKCIWDVFNGNNKHRTKKEQQQITWFNESFEKESNEVQYSLEAKNLLISNFSNQEICYDKIKEFVISNTMLNSNQIIKNILLPLINENKVIKCNKNGIRDYKKDNFIFK